MGEFEAIEEEWTDLENNGLEDRFAEFTEPTAEDLEAEFAERLGY